MSYITESSGDQRQGEQPACAEDLDTESSGIGSELEGDGRRGAFVHTVAPTTHHPPCAPDELEAVSLADKGGGNEGMANAAVEMLVVTLSDVSVEVGRLKSRLAQAAKNMESSR